MFPLLSISIYLANLLLTELARIHPNMVNSGSKQIQQQQKHPGISQKKLYFKKDEIMRF